MVICEESTFFSLKKVIYAIKHMLFGQAQQRFAHSASDEALIIFYYFLNDVFICGDHQDIHSFL